MTQPTPQSWLDHMRAILRGEASEPPIADEFDLPRHQRSLGRYEPPDDAA